ncbi:TonB-dependent receptor [Sphingomonas sp.]|uniref:TonB-dependent receptor n=1 Tax=Sphingomonas sp. TaxID=28214 RepID=UPI002EDB28E9
MSLRTVNKLLVGASLTAIGIACPVGSFAQTTTDDPAPITGTAGDQEGQPGQLDEIVVTAQRRSENLQRAAVAIDVVGAEEMSRTGVVTAASLNAAVPSLVVTKAGGANTSFYVRGVGNFTVNASGDPAIAFNYDGVYLGRPTSTTLTFFDLERVEVLKGPQGILYGRNATGGAINVVPAKPQPGELSGYGSVGYGSFNALDLEAAINLPLGPDGAIRVSGKSIKADGYNSDGTNDEKGEGLRVQLLANLTPNLSVRVAADYSHQGGVGPGASINGIIRYTPGSAATATSIANYTFTPSNFDPYSGLHSPQARALQSTLVIPGAFINPAPYTYPFLDNDYVGVNAEIKLDTGIGSFTFIPAYRDARLNIRFNGPGFNGGRVTEHDEQFSAELRLDGKRLGPVEWLLGAYYYDESVDARYTFAQYQVNPYQRYFPKVKSYAGFGRLIFNLSEQFRLVGGARYTMDRKSFQTLGQTVIEICTRPPPPAGPGCFGGPSIPVADDLAQLRTLIPFPTAPGPQNSVAYGTFGNRVFYSELAYTRKTSTNRLTYRLAAEYDVGPRSLLYASYETGYRSGGFNNTLGKESFGPEYIKAATLGIKNRFLDNRLQLNAEAFYWQYTDQQVSHFGFDANNASSLLIENAGSADIMGVEVDTQFLATPTTLLRGSVQYLDNKLKDFNYAVPRVPTPPPPGGTPTLPQVIGCPSVETVNSTGQAIYAVSCSGKPGYNSPKWSVNAGIEQTVELGAFKLVLTGDGRYRSNRVIGFEQLAQQQSGEDLTFDASATLMPASENWALTAYVRNIGNVAVPVLSQYSGSVGGIVAINYAPPRTYGVHATFKF